MQALESDAREQSPELTLTAISPPAELAHPFNVMLNLPYGCRIAVQDHCTWNCCTNQSQCAETHQDTYVLELHAQLGTYRSNELSSASLVLC